ncbi:MAG: hypothetical protein ACYC27_08915 [Armatimonadota bacterium]
MIKASLKRCAAAAAILMVVAMMVTIRTESAEDKDHISWFDMENDYIWFGIGTDGAWQPEAPEGSTGIAHAIDTNIPLSGRFEIWRNAGNPDVVEDDGTPLFVNHYLLPGRPSMGDRFAYWGIQVDDGDGGWVSFDTGGKAGIIAAEPNSGWSDYPYRPTNAFPGLMTGTAYMAGNIKCNLEVRLMHDTVKFRWRITNEDIIQHYIGMKLVGDVSTYGGGDGFPYVMIPGRNVIEAETLIKGSEIPAELEMFDNPRNPRETIRFTFNAQGATPPDVVGIDYWGIILSDVWSYFGSPNNPLFLYEPTPNHPIGDLALGAMWKPRAVRPGQTIDIVSYIGLADTTAVYNKPNEEVPQYVATVQGPNALGYVYSSTPGDSTLSPIPFNINAFLGDQEKYMDLTNASASIILPDSLELDDTELEGATKTIGKVPVGGERGVSWLVRPVGNPTGIFEYSVSFNAAPVGGTVVKRKINIPATPTQIMPKGWSMISMPYNVSQDLSEDAPPPAPGNAGDLSVLGLQGELGTDYKLWKYDPHTGKYVRPEKLVAGEGYWLWCRSTGQSTEEVPGWKYIPINWTGSTGKQIPFYRGWNLIGNPFVYTVTLGECYFYHPDYGTLPYEDAVKQGLISKTVYWYDTTYGRYRNLSDRTVQIKPWNSYWVKALQPSVTMLISPASQIGANLQGGIGISSNTSAATDTDPIPGASTEKERQLQTQLETKAP